MELGKEQYQVIAVDTTSTADQQGNDSLVVTHACFVKRRVAVLPARLGRGHPSKTGCLAWLQLSNSALALMSAAQASKEPAIAAIWRAVFSLYHRLAVSRYQLGFTPCHTLS